MFHPLGAAVSRLGFMVWSKKSQTQTLQHVRGKHHAHAEEIMHTVREGKPLLNRAIQKNHIIVFYK